MKVPAALVMMMASIIKLLGFPGAAVESEIAKMFNEWGVGCWEELTCFGSDDVEKFIVASESTALRQQCLCKQLDFLIMFA